MGAAKKAPRVAEYAELTSDQQLEQIRFARSEVEAQQKHCAACKTALRTASEELKRRQGLLDRAIAGERLEIFERTQKGGTA